MSKFRKYTVNIFLFVLVFIALSSIIKVKAALKPVARENSVILYTDDDPYTFHFTNLLPDAQVTFSTSKKSVIKIKDSQAVPGKAGKATVTIKIKQDGETFKIKVKFTVKKVPVVKEKDYVKLAKKQVEALNKNATKKTNWVAIDSSEKMHTMEDLDRHISDYTRRYIGFYVYVDDFSLLRSEEEYLDMFPYLAEFYFSDPKIYTNTYAVKINCKSKVSWMDYDEEGIQAAILTGNTSFLNKEEKALYKKVTKEAKKLKKETVYDTVKEIYDYVIKLVDYEYDTSNEERYSLSGAYNVGKVVCAGYSKLFYFLCISNDINCIMVEGSSRKDADSDINYSSHAWNLVEINHKWYGIEATWDDCYDSETGYNGTPYRYFLISDDTMRENHIWEEDKYPAAVSKDLGIRYSYFEEYPMLTGKKETMDYVKDTVKKFSDSGKKEYKLEFCETSYSDETFNAVNSYLNKCDEYFKVHWKDWHTDKMPFHGGWIYHITLYKK